MYLACVPVEAQRVEEIAYMPVVVVLACSLNTRSTVKGHYILPSFSAAISSSTIN